MIAMRCRLLALMLFFVFPIPAQTIDTSADAVDSYVQSELQRQHIPGLSLLVAYDGTIVRAQGYGLANVELQVSVKPETIFQSGSPGDR